MHALWEQVEERKSWGGGRKGSAALGMKEAKERVLAPARHFQDLNIKIAEIKHGLSI